MYIPCPVTDFKAETSRLAPPPAIKTKTLCVFLCFWLFKANLNFPQINYIIICV